MEIGKRLLPSVVDHFAETEPSRVYASIPKSSTSFSEGYHDITMVHLAAMVNYTSNWLEDHVGRGSFEPVAYIGLPDIRYAVIFLAAVKVGYKALFISPRNQQHQNESMLKRSSCKIILYAEETAAPALVLAEALPDLRPLAGPSLDQLLKTPRDTQHYRYDKTFAEARDEPCLVLHSSGSTGDPKLVTLTHGTFSVTDNDRRIRVPPGRKAQNGSQFDFDDGGGRFYSCFPPYHLAGVQSYITLPIFADGATVVFGPRLIPPSGYIVSEILKVQDLKALWVPPSIIQDWFSQPVSREQAKNLKVILYAGGPLSPSIGDELSRITAVCQVYGSLETGQIQLLTPQAGEWSYMELNPYDEADMQPTDDGSFELVLHQNPKLAAHRCLWHNFPNIKTWRTRDLFVPHPSKPGLWRFHSRLDDTIVLGNGFKVRPVEMETMIQGDPMLTGALMVGQGKPRVLLLVEAEPEAFKRHGPKNIAELIWPRVQEANKIAPTYAQVSCSDVFVTSPDKPFVRAPKGTVVRRLTIEAYAKEIDAFFCQSSGATSNEDTTLHDNIDDFSPPTIRQFIRRSVKVALPEVQVADTDNLFLLGLDSKGTTALSRILQQGLGSHARLGSQDFMSLQTIYKYPTIHALTKITLDLISGGSMPDVSIDSSGADGIDFAIDEFTANLPVRGATTATSQADGGEKVALIGPRGSVGVVMVKEFLLNPAVTKIYCLNRGQDGREKMSQEFRVRGMSDDATDKRLEFMVIDLSKPRLGLSDDDCKQLLSDVTVFIHNAWKVNFNWTLDLFKGSYLLSVRETISLSLESSLRPRVVFISSVASVQEWPATHTTTPVPETPVSSHEVSSRLGYGQSKHVAEHILQKASEGSGVSVSIIRMGQVAGPTPSGEGGRWPTHEWLPSLVSLSKVLNLIPNDLRPIQWVPVDLAAKAICELSLAEAKSGRGGDGRASVFHLVNPKSLNWTIFADALNRRLPNSLLVPFIDWVDAALRQEPDREILPYFQYLAKTMASGIALSDNFETDKAVSASTTMAMMKAVDTNMIDLWLDHMGI